MIATVYSPVLQPSPRITSKYFYQYFLCWAIRESFDCRCQSNYHLVELFLSVFRLFELLLQAQYQRELICFVWHFNGLLLIKNNKCKLNHFLSVLLCTSITCKITLHWNSFNGKALAAFMMKFLVLWVLFPKFNILVAIVSKDELTASF